MPLNWADEVEENPEEEAEAAEETEEVDTDLANAEKEVVDIPAPPPPGGPPE